MDKWGKISANLCDNEERLRQIFHADKNKDIIIRDFETAGGIKCMLLYIDGMADADGINDFIIRPLMRCDYGADDFNKFNVIQYGDCTPVTTIDDAVERVLQGDTPIFFDGDCECAVCETKGFEKRSVSTPETESVIKGSHEAFNESIRSDITLVRRAVKSPDLVTEMISVGSISGEKCALLYLDNVTDDALVESIKTRLSEVKADYISGCGMVEQMIGDSKWSVFPSMLSTERPERAAQYLNSGRVVVICDNTPFAIIMPVTLQVLLDSPEGNQQRWQNGTFSRLIRSFAFLCATLLSGLYIAILNFHQDILPPPLLNLILDSRADIPFSSLMELIVMEVFFELVREAGIRVPNAVGSAIGVVGGLILGQAAVDAGMVSPVTLIIVAISGLSNAVLPDYDLSFGIRMIKFALILLGGTMGLFGFFAGVAVIILLLCGQKSLGRQYIETPFCRNSVNSNSLMQIPLWKQEFRKSKLNPKRKRQQPDVSRKWEEKK